MEYQRPDMAKLVVLGTSFVIPDETHENTHLALLGESGLVLVDCPGRVMIRLRRAGLDPYQINDLILTHFHPDHVDGVPMLIMEMWLRGRKTPLRLHGLPHCMQRMENLMLAYDQATWPNLFPITYHVIAEQDHAPVLENTDFTITATPVKHFIPTLGLRVTDKRSGRVLAYSCDTEPCPGAVTLAANAEVLIHEAAGAGWGHSSAAQAGEVAQEAKAKSLVLIHYRTGGPDLGQLISEAQSAYTGPVRLAEDLMTLEW
jgi:ribonuclease Z